MVRKKIVGLAHGVFDVLHIGHSKYLREAKKNCDYLITSITADKFVNKGPDRPIFNQELRKEFLQSLKFVDEVIISNDFTPINILKKLKPDLYFKGSDYSVFEDDVSKNILKEKTIVEKFGGQLKIINQPLFSSSSIINKSIKPFNDSFVKEAKNNINKNLYDILRKNLKLLKNKKIHVYGDIIVDQYTNVEVLGKSQKNNIISSKFKNSSAYGGGSILVANFLAEFSDKVSLITFSNKKAEKIYKKYLSKKIKLIKINDKNYLPIIKNRFIDNYKGFALFQLNKYENLNLYNYSGVTNIFNKNNSIQKVILDYGYNFFNKNIIGYINKNKNFSINCQTNSSNFGYNLITKYIKGDIICMDEDEFRLSFSNNKDDIKKMIKDNFNFINLFKIFIITTGKKGCYFIRNKKITHVPVFREIFGDTTGCGDIFFGAVSFFKNIKELSAYDICFCSHVCAFIHGSYRGNKNQVTEENFLKLVNNLLK